MKDSTISKSKGLGDDVKKITSAMKLDILAERVAQSIGKSDCGCSKRQAKLNKMFPYGDKK